MKRGAAARDDLRADATENTRTPIPAFGSLGIPILRVVVHAAFISTADIAARRAELDDHRTLLVRYALER